MQLRCAAAADIIVSLPARGRGPVCSRGVGSNSFPAFTSTTGTDVTIRWIVVQRAHFNYCHPFPGLVPACLRRPLSLVGITRVRLSANPDLAGLTTGTRARLMRKREGPATIYAPFSLLHVPAGRRPEPTPFWSSQPAMWDAVCAQP